MTCIFKCTLWPCFFIVVFFSLVDGAFIGDRCFYQLIKVGNVWGESTGELKDKHSGGRGRDTNRNIERMEFQS